MNNCSVPVVGIITMATAFTHLWKLTLLSEQAGSVPTARSVRCAGKYSTLVILNI